MTEPFSPPAPSELLARISAYLMGGGLWNPELANHDAVRDLLIDCRDALAKNFAPVSETTGSVAVAKERCARLADLGGYPETSAQILAGIVELEQQLAEAHELLQECVAATTDIDPRIDWVEAQIDKDTMLRIGAALKEAKP